MSKFNLIISLILLFFWGLAPNQLLGQDCEIGWVCHKVIKGNTLFRLSQAYNVQIQDLIELNQLKSADEIQIGQLLKIKRSVLYKPILRTSSVPRGSNSRIDKSNWFDPFNKPKNNYNQIAYSDIYEDDGDYFPGGEDDIRGDLALGVLRGQSRAARASSITERNITERGGSDYRNRDYYPRYNEEPANYNRGLERPTRVRSSYNRRNDIIPILHHVVKKGETLDKIGQKYGIYPGEIIRYNKLRNGFIREGQILKIRRIR